MPSVTGLLEEEQRAARQRVEELREQTDPLLAELGRAESDWPEPLNSPPPAVVAGVLP